MIRLLSATAGALLLSACASLPEPVTQRPEHDNRMLMEISQALPGDYLASQNRAEREAGEAAVHLSIEALPSEQLGQIGFTLRQRQGDAPPRHFLLAMSLGDQGRVVGAFAPLNELGQVRRRCEMRFALGSDGLSGETNPENCRFGADLNTGLLKEIAFDGTQLVIADRLIDLVTGQAVGSDQIMRFVRVQSYTAWAGRREGEHWRLARDFELTSGATVEPSDAASMSLGLLLTLEAIELQDGGQVKLRLSAADSASGEVLGQAWADPRAESLGLALPTLQVGLELRAP